MFTIEINDQQSAMPIDTDPLRRATEIVLMEEGLIDAAINIAIVDDPTIHDLNRRFLEHDEPTDVLSFVLENEPMLEGDVIVSADTAARSAEQYGWSAADELLLYVIHGLLHLVGYDDIELPARAEMRDRERHYLDAFGLRPRYDESSSPNDQFASTSGSGGTSLAVSPGRAAVDCRPDSAS